MRCARTRAVRHSLVVCRATHLRQLLIIHSCPRPLSLALPAGSFIFIYGILTSGKENANLKCAAALIVALTVASGHTLNPAATAQTFIKADNDHLTTLATIVAQCLGGILALQVGCYLGSATKAKKSAAKDDNLKSSIMEFIGTFVFFLGANAGGSAVATGTALFVAASMIDYGHFNPAVTIMSVFQNSTHPENAACWIGAQIVAVFAAVKVAAYCH